MILDQRELVLSATKNWLTQARENPELNLILSQLPYIDEVVEAMTHQQLHVLQAMMQAQYLKGKQATKAETVKAPREPIAQG